MINPEGRGKYFLAIFENFGWKFMEHVLYTVDFIFLYQRKITPALAAVVCIFKKSSQVVYYNIKLSRPRHFVHVKWVNLENYVTKVGSVRHSPVNPGGQDSTKSVYSLISSLYPSTVMLGLQGLPSLPSTPLVIPPCSAP